MRDRLDYGAIVDSIPDALVVIDHQGKILLVSRAAEAQFGYSHGELVSQDVEVLVPIRFRLLHRKELAKYRSAPQTRLMVTGLELTALRRNGTEIPVSVSANALQLKGGEITIVTVRDLTHYKDVEAKLGALLETAPDAMIV